MRFALPKLAVTFSATLMAQVSAAGVNLLNSMVIAHAIGPGGRGEVAFFTAVSGALGFLASFSAHEWLTNEVGHNKQSANSVLGACFVLTLPFGLLGALVALAVFGKVPFIQAGNFTLAIIVGALAVPIAVFFTFLSGILRGLAEHATANYALLVTSVVSIGGNYVWMLTGQLTTNSAVTCWALGFVAGCGLIVVQLRNVGVRPSRPALGQLRSAISFGAKAHLAGTMNTVSYKLDQWILGMVAGTNQLGVYAVAAAWFEGIFLIPQAMALSLRSKVLGLPEKEAVKASYRGLKFGLVVTCVCAGLLAALAPFLCETLFGQEFKESTTLLRILALGAIGICVMKILSMSLVAAGKPLAESAATGIGFVVAIIAYFSLVPKYHALGAAWGSVITYTVVGLSVLLIFRFTRRETSS